MHVLSPSSSSSQVSILDAAAVGEVLETFPVCSSPIKCIAAIPEFDDKDPDILSSKWMQWGEGEGRCVWGGGDVHVCMCLSVCACACLCVVLQDILFSHSL